MYQAELLHDGEAFNFWFHSPLVSMGMQRGGGGPGRSHFRRDKCAFTDFLTQPPRIHTHTHTRTPCKQKILKGLTLRLHVTVLSLKLKHEYLWRLSFIQNCSIAEKVLNGSSGPRWTLFKTFSVKAWINSNLWYTSIFIIFFFLHAPHNWIAFWIIQSAAIYNH